MIMGYPTVYWIAGGAGIAVVLLVAVFWWWQRRKLNKEVERLTAEVEAGAKPDADPLAYAEETREPTKEEQIKIAIRAVKPWAEDEGMTLSEAATLTDYSQAWVSDKVENWRRGGYRDLVGDDGDEPDPLAYAEDETGEPEAEAPDGGFQTTGHTIDLEPPDVGGSFMGLFAMWRHRAKAKKLARKGYVKWYKIGARRRRPTWVKPNLDGAGEPEYYDSSDEVTYLFPEEAMVPDGETGAWIAEHRIGEVEPINLREPMAPPLDADRLEEVINLEAESDAPSFFDRLDIDTTTLMWLLIGGGFLVFAAMRYMG